MVFIMRSTLLIELNLYWTQNISSQREASEPFANDLNDSEVQITLFHTHSPSTAHYKHQSIWANGCNCTAVMMRDRFTTNMCLSLRTEFILHSGEQWSSNISICSAVVLLRRRPPLKHTQNARRRRDATQTSLNCSLGEHLPANTMSGVWTKLHVL